jgi:hypothetical protein
MSLVLTLSALASSALKSLLYWLLHERHLSNTDDGSIIWPVRVIAYRVADDFNRISTYLVDYEVFMNGSLGQSGRSHNADKKYRENNESFMLSECKRNRKFTGLSSIIDSKRCPN